MAKKKNDGEDVKYEQIAVRMEKTLKDNIDLAAKCEGLTTPEWVRAALNYYLLTKTNVCENCGTYNSLDSKYCKRCGGELIDIQQRLIKKRGEILAYFSIGCDLNTLIYNKLSKTTELNDLNIRTLINNMTSLIQSWPEKSIILENLQEEILQYGSDTEIINQLEVQFNLIDNIDKTISTYPEKLNQIKLLLSEPQNSK